MREIRNQFGFWLKVLPGASAVGVIIVGGLVLTGWALDLEWLKRIDSKLAAMNSPMAVAFILAGLMLTLLTGSAWLKSRAAQRQAEISRRSSETRFQAFMDNSPAIAWIKDDQYRLVYVNQQFTERMGLSAEQVRGHTGSEIAPEEVARQSRISDEQVLTEGRRVEAVLHVPEKDGVVRPWLTLKFPFRDETGRMFIGAKAIDISERVKAEQLFRLVVDSTPCGIVMTDAHGKITLVNTETEKLLGYRREELVGQSVDVLVPACTRGRHAHHRAGYYAAPEARKMGAGRNLCAKAKDGREIPVEIGINPVTIENQTMVLASIVDITERLRAEEEIKRRADALASSNAELEQFAYVASHDLQEPLRMVGSYLQLLERRYKGRLDADADEFIGFAVDGANRMKQLIMDLLAFSRVGRQGGQIVPTDTAQVLRESLANLKAAVEESGARVTADPLPTVPADPSQLRQLFQNLIGNALKFHGQARPEVHVSAERAGSQWTFAVRDNGIGIDPQFASRIFEVFQRLHTRTEYPGTGIGLAICKKIVERHHGRIWVDSEPDHGATFRFTWPAAQEQLSHEQKRAA